MGADATPEQKLMWQEVCRNFRHGDSHVGFAGFNDNATTNWTTHGEKMAEAGKANSQIAAQMRSLPKSDDYEWKKSELEKQVIDIPRTLGFCKTIGLKERIQKINRPDLESQRRMNHVYNSHTRARNPFLQPCALSCRKCEVLERPAVCVA